MADVVVVDVEVRDKTKQGLAKVNRSLGDTSTKAGGLTGRIKGLSAAIGPAGLAGAAIAGAAAVGVKLVSSFLSGNTEIARMSTSLGIGTDTLQKWQFAAEQTGTELEVIGDASRTFSERILEARQGSADAKEQFDLLGLSAEELGRLTPEDQMIAMIDALAGIEDQSTRTAIGQALLGDDYARLSPLIDGGTGALKRYGDQAEKNGILTEAQIRASERSQIAFGNFNNALKGVVNQGIAALLPAIEGLATFLSETVAPFISNTLIPVLTRLITDGLEKVETFVKDDLIPIIEDLQEIFEVAWPIIKEAVRIAISLIQERVGGVIDTFTGLITFISGVFSGDWDKAWDGIRVAFAGAIRLMLAPLRAFLEVLSKVPFVGGGARAAIEFLDSTVESLKDTTSDAEKEQEALEEQMKETKKAADDERTAFELLEQTEIDFAKAARNEANAAMREQQATAKALEARINSLTGALSRNSRQMVIQATIASAATGDLGIDVAGPELAALISRNRVFDAIDAGLPANTVATAGAISTGGGGGGGGGTSASGSVGGSGGIQQLTRIAGQRLGEISAHTFYNLEATRDVAAFTNPEFLVKTMERGVYRGTLAALGEWQRLTPPPALSGTEAVLNLASPAQLGTTRSSNVGAPA